MGCVSSKHLSQQARLDDSPVKRRLSHRSKSANQEVSLEDYHRHLVALTSSTYGLLKMERPNSPENVKKSPARMGSMNDMYDRLKVLESLESTPKSWNEVSNVLQTLKPSNMGRSISMPEQGMNRGGGQETINVADIMQGLEEEGASGSSSPAQNVCATAVSSDQISHPPPPPPFPEESDMRTHRRSGKAASLKNPTQDLQLSPLTAHASTNQILPTSLPEEPTRISAHTAGSHHKGNFLGGFDENAQSLNAEKKFLTKNSGIDQQNQKNPHLLTKSATVTNASVVEDRYVHRDNQVGCINPAIPSNLKFSTSSRRLTVTLNLEYESTFFTGTPISQDASSPAGSSARRSLIDALTEPGSPLFDPALLASYEKALQELRKEEWNIVRDSTEPPKNTRPSKEVDIPLVQVSEVEQQLELGEPSDDDDADAGIEMQSYDPLDGFEWRCPPSGEELVVLYTTTLRGIRKTFEDCNNVREILRSFSVGINERDVSMHATFRNELKELMGGAVPVPRLFIKGRYIGGVDDAIKLHEEGKLARLLEGLPQDSNIGVCDGCGGVRFVPCLECSGSRKIVGKDKNVLRCPQCNENGLIYCPVCA